MSFSSANVRELLWTLFEGLLAPLHALQQRIEQWRHENHLKKQFKGPRPLPLLGNVLDFFPATSEVVFNYFKENAKKFGSLFAMYIGPIFVLITAYKEDNELILSGNEYLSKGFLYKFLVPWLGDGLLLSSGEKWRARRKMLTPAFHFNILDQFVPVFNSCGSEFVVQLRKRMHSGPLDVWPLVKRCALDVVCETVMGVKMNSQTNSNSDYVKAVNDMSDIIYKQACSPWLYPEWIFRLTPLGRRHKQCLEILHGTTDRVIRERKDELEILCKDGAILGVDDLGRRRRIAFLDMLLLAARDGSFSDKDIREEVDNFMFAGHDTTSVAISFCIFFLSRNQHVQEKLMEELQSVFDPSKSLKPTLNELSELKYLEMVIKEAMRIYPPVTTVARQITSDMKLKSQPLTVPAGSTLFMSFYLLHRNEEVFPDPQAFDPERFAPDEVARRHPFAYLPFSAGSRNCIGQRFAMLEMKSVLAKVVWNFRILPDPDFEPNVTWEITMKSKNGINVCLEERIRS